MVVTHLNQCKAAAQELGLCTICNGFGYDQPTLAGECLWVISASKVAWNQAGSCDGSAATCAYSFDQQPICDGTATPTTSPTTAPSASPTASPTQSPTATPTGSPTTTPTISPTASPTATPTASPTSSPTASPTSSPTASPTVHPCVQKTVVGTVVTITVACDTADALTNWCDNCLGDEGVTALIIEKAQNVTETVTWTDFHFVAYHQDTTLTIRGLTLATTTIDYFAIYVIFTKLYMRDVVVSGYSGRPGEVGGGAIGVQDVNYCSDSPAPSAADPALSNVTVVGNCRGFRLQDTHCPYVKDCNAINNTDNSFFFAAGKDASPPGCAGGTFDSCVATQSGQVGFLIIGGANNTVKNSVVDGSRGAGVMIYNTDGDVSIRNVAFHNANTIEPTTPYGGPTDDAGGASLGVAQAADRTGRVTVYSSQFYGGGVPDYSVVWHVSGAACDSRLTFSAGGPSLYAPDAYNGLPDSDQECIDTAGLLMAPTASPTASPTTDSPTGSPTAAPTTASPTHSPTPYRYHDYFLTTSKHGYILECDSQMFSGVADNTTCTEFAVHDNSHEGIYAPLWPTRHGEYTAVINTDDSGTYSLFRCTTHACNHTTWAGGDLAHLVYDASIDRYIALSRDISGAFEFVAIDMDDPASVLTAPAPLCSPDCFMSPYAGSTVITSNGTGGVSVCNFSIGPDFAAECDLLITSSYPGHITMATAYMGTQWPVVITVSHSTVYRVTGTTFTRLPVPEMTEIGWAGYDSEGHLMIAATDDHQVGHATDDTSSLVVFVSGNDTLCNIWPEPEGMGFIDFDDSEPESGPESGSESGSGSGSGSESIDLYVFGPRARRDHEIIDVDDDGTSYAEDEYTLLCHPVTLHLLAAASFMPTALPSVSPTSSPSASPTESPTEVPTQGPTASPSSSPTVSPTRSPSASPTESPTGVPTQGPTASPSSSPTIAIKQVRVATSVRCSSYSALGTSLQDAFKGACKAWFFNTTGENATVSVNCDEGTRRRRSSDDVPVETRYTLREATNTSMATKISNMVFLSFQIGNTSIPLPQGVNFTITAETVTAVASLSTGQPVCDTLGTYFVKATETCQECDSGTYDIRGNYLESPRQLSCDLKRAACNNGDKLQKSSSPTIDNLCVACDGGGSGTTAGPTGTHSSDTCNLCESGWGFVDDLPNGAVCVECTHTTNNHNSAVDNSPCNTHEECPPGQGYIYVNAPGGCTDCAAGFFSDSTGYQPCSAHRGGCRTGTYVVPGGATSDNLCVNCGDCPADYVRESCRGDAPGTCTSCNPGFNSSGVYGEPCVAPVGPAPLAVAHTEDDEGPPVWVLVGASACVLLVVGVLAMLCYKHQPEPDTPPFKPSNKTGAGPPPVSTETDSFI